MCEIDERLLEGATLCFFVGFSEPRIAESMFQSAVDIPVDLKSSIFQVSVCFIAFFIFKRFYLSQ